MIFFPAIDLKDGVCVRLVKGDMSQSTVFNDSPADQARQFSKAGAEWLHVVDLNGAFAGVPVNTGAVKDIIASGIPVQLGGGIRTMETVDSWFRAGVGRVVLGTAAVKAPDLVRQACRAYPGRIAVGIDARSGKVATEGWADVSELTTIDISQRFVDSGVAAIIHTDIDRDGLLTGPNVVASAELARAVPIPVIVSGGVSSLEDLRAVKAEADSGIAGVIVGRAVYDGSIDIKAAAALLNE
ncbi:MAG TPA: 1-(5-phosphoribosyl)-5-[(5-phosphoribosylamino)methylideneamino]imidazole-4-carboxamide isomerase [Rhodospirillaceae bacterium]|nr:1-(5-phosphoribosyl)-5-[(5-phosphoribosylamino)methylideneamino]imidazole-4-carboxamide isomerase [Candidatus Neomarinimicrobiota bacterium]HCX14358.1 1-(5-phosphoribosyl)-5-[(5-phosphoribosylamino)methylideneamino]imidazole-4-carboxamide isomerase [Rhodospirillaceae bacterium]